MNTGFTVGVFDLFHIGHLNMIKKASNCCDRLVVGVHDDVYKIKKKEFIYTLEERLEIIRSLRYVAEAIPYKTVDSKLVEVDPDVFICGEDQNNDFFIRALDWCDVNGIKVIKLPRTPSISSSSIRARLKTIEV